MARRHRVWFPGAMYHITARGNRRTAIFLNDLDYIEYFQILSETRVKYPFYLHSYCLMTNHIHLQIETTEYPISDIMKDLDSTYARYFNKTYQTSGHVFQGRFISKVIEDRQYFLEVSRYIHRNPLEAKIVDKPEDYPWSSYASYINEEENTLKTKDRTLNLLPGDSIHNYKSFVEEGIKRSAEIALPL